MILLLCPDGRRMSFTFKFLVRVSNTRIIVSEISPLMISPTESGILGLSLCVTDHLITRTATVIDHLSIFSKSLNWTVMKHQILYRIYSGLIDYTRPVTIDVMLTALSAWETLMCNLARLDQLSMNENSPPGLTTITPVTASDVWVASPVWHYLNDQPLATTADTADRPKEFTK